MSEQLASSAPVILTDGSRYGASRSNQGPFTEIPEQLVATQTIAAAATTYYTVPALTSNNSNQLAPRTRLEEVVLGNWHTIPVTVSLYRVPSGGSPGAGNAFAPNITLQPNEMVIIKLAQIFPTGATLRAICNVAAVCTISASGTEFYPQ